MKKTCKKCKITKLETDFYYEFKPRRCLVCKTCVSERMKEYRLLNIGKVKENKRLAFQRLTPEQKLEHNLKKKHIEVKCKTCGKLFIKRQDTLKSWSGFCVSHARQNPDREMVFMKERARKEMYSLVHGTLRRLKQKKVDRSVKILGYSALDLYGHINKNLKEGMTWNDRRKWHIDHIKPVSRFIEEGIFEPKIINALSNLQPLWAFENLSKRAAWVGF